MRITEYEKNVIIEAVKNIDPAAQVWLFGSRTDDSKKGGDIDIAVLSSEIELMREIEIKQKICDKIGEQKIDIVVSQDGQDTFFKYSVSKGILLHG